MLRVGGTSGSPPTGSAGGSRGTKDWVLAMGCRVAHLPWPMAFWWMKCFAKGKGDRDGAGGGHL